MKGKMIHTLLLNAFAYVTIIALTIYIMTLTIPELPSYFLPESVPLPGYDYYTNVTANTLSYAIFLVLILLASLTLRNRRPLIVPFLLGAYKVVQSLTLYYISSKKYSIESLGLLLDQLRYSINLLYTIVFSTSMAELITLLLFILCLIVAKNMFKKELLFVPLALVILSMLFITSSIINIYYTTYIAALFMLALNFLYMLRERKNIVFGF